MNISQLQDATLDKVTKHHIDEEDRISKNYYWGKEVSSLSQLNAVKSSRITSLGPYIMLVELSSDNR